MTDRGAGAASQAHGKLRRDLHVVVDSGGALGMQDVPGPLPRLQDVLKPETQTGMH